MIYMSIAGPRYDAYVQVYRADGSVDLAVDAGSGDWVELTRIPVVEPDDLRKGTCAHAETGKG